LGVDVFFVCGAPKSGTTWLQRILDAHPEVCCSGEGHFITRFSVPVAKVVNAYNRDLGVEARLVYEDQPYYGGIDQDEFDEVVRGFILKRMRARAGAETRWIGDKTPSYTRNLTELNRLFPAAKIIHIVRDPREVAVSRMAFNKRAGAKDACTPGAEQHRETLESAVESWIAAVTAVDVFAKTRPGLVHELRYRDLHDDPIGESERLFRFLGAAAPQVLLEQIAGATSFEALSGRRPGEEDPASFLRKGVPDDWQARLDPASAQLVSESCGPLMREKRFAA
jgi:sulfotransferase family protein